MRLPYAEIGPIQPRGLYQLPALGTSGIHAIIAVTSRGYLLDDDVFVIPRGSDHVAAVDAIWDRLDVVDPIDETNADSVRRSIIRAVH